MGWLWSSSTSSSSASPPSPSPTTPLISSSSSSSSSPSTSQQPATLASQSQPQAHNRDNDPEIQKFLDLLASDSQSPPPPPSRSTSPSTDPARASAISNWLSSKLKAAPPPPPTPKLPPVSESLLPTEMSCRQAFDLAWSCNSLGGQWNAVYRHGTMRSCSDHWDAFWFCMRSKSYTTGGVKEDAVREHYRRLEYEKYYAPGRPSSEDVWEARVEKVQPGTAFAEPIDLPQVSDEEWRSRDEERRKKVRKDLGF